MTPHLLRLIILPLLHLINPHNKGIAQVYNEPIWAQPQEQKKELLQFPFKTYIIYPWAFIMFCGRERERSMNRAINWSFPESNERRYSCIYVDIRFRSPRTWRNTSWNASQLNNIYIMAFGITTELHTRGVTSDGLMPLIHLFSSACATQRKSSSSLPTSNIRCCWRLWLYTLTAWLTDYQ